MLALIEHLGHKRCILVAHDWGGAVAWGLAAAYPHYVQKLIIINSPHPATFARELLHSAEQQAASKYMNLFRSDAAEEVLAADNFARLFEAHHTWGGKPWMTEEERAAYLQAWSQPGALTGGLNYYRERLGLNREGRPADREALAAIAAAATRFKVEVPTLVIWGERDAALRPSLLDGLADYVSKLTVQRIPDATHWVVHEQPEQVNRLIRSFIQAN
jgi:pimeloyl-ACP methyl ester carboxylesterase